MSVISIAMKPENANKLVMVVGIMGEEKNYFFDNGNAKIGDFREKYCGSVAEVFVLRLGDFLSCCDYGSRLYDPNFPRS